MRQFLIASITLFFFLDAIVVYHAVAGDPAPSPTQFASAPPVQQAPVEPSPEPPPKPVVVPDFIQVKQYRKPTDDSVLADIIAHSRQRAFGNGHGRATNAHETSHGIHSEVRNEHMRANNRVNAFYVLKGRAVVIKEPKMRKRHVAEFVPKSLRSYRYSLYISGSHAWDDTPLYIFDEWQAYVNGGKCNIEDVQKGIYRGGWTDGVSGCLGFSIYAVATAMAIEKRDPDYWKNNKQFKKYLIWNLKESYKTYMIGSKMAQFKWDKQDALFKKLRTDPSAAKMREFINTHLEGVWLKD